MAEEEAGVEASGASVADNGKVAKDLGGVTDREFVPEEGEKSRALVEEAAEEKGEKDVKEVKSVSEKEGEGKADDGEVKEEPLKKKRGRKPREPTTGETPVKRHKKSEVSSGGEPLTPIDRPARERKSIERFVATIKKEKVKGVQILKGNGTLLKDIPNVAYNISKRSKADATLSSLHALLFGGHRVKGTILKRNILQFSGYVWGQNQEKDKSKVKEKLDRLTKEGLLTIASILDIKVSKTGIKKEELVWTVLEFLESPHQTTDELLEEKEQEVKGKKRKSLTPGKRGRPAKKQKTDDTPKSGRKKGQPLEEAAEEPFEEEEEEETDAKASQKDAYEDDEFEGKKESRKKSTKGKASSVIKEQKLSEEKDKKKNMKTSLKSPSTSKANVSKESPKSALKVLPKKNKKGKEVKQDAKKELKGKTGKEFKAAEKFQSKSNAGGKSSPSAGKNVAKGKEPAKPDRPPQVFPTDEQLRAEICELLQDADFSTVTFTDVVKQLEGKFNVSLFERKAHVKVLIREELSKIVEEGDDGEGKNEDQTGQKTEMDGKKA